MSIWVLIISFIVLFLSIRSMKSLFKSNDKLQEEFIKSYEEGLKTSEEKVFTASIVLVALLYTIIWITFYVIAFNVFNSVGLYLSLIAVFFLLETIYNFFGDLVMFGKKQIKRSLVNRVLNVIELIYIVYFIYYYVVTRIG